VDISHDALDVARSNAAHLNLKNRVTFSQSDLLGRYLSGGQAFDMVVSNPPYVGDSEADKLQVDVREHEPHAALFGGGKEGLDIYRSLIPQAARVLKAGGWLVIEIGYTQEQPIRGLLAGWKEVRSVADLRGIPRVMVAQAG